MDWKDLRPPLTLAQQQALLELLNSSAADDSSAEAKPLRAMPGHASARLSRESNVRGHFFSPQMISAFPSLLMILDADMRYIFGTDPLIVRHFHVRPLSGVLFKDLLEEAVSAGWIQKTLENCRRCLQDETALCYTDTIHLLNHPPLHVHTTLSPVMGPDDQPLGVVFLLHDLDDLAALQAAESAANAKSNFLANMSHELRTPLNAIFGMANFLRASHLDDTQRGYVSGILRAADCLLNMINDILDFSTIDAKKLEIHPQEYDLVDLIRESTHLISMGAAEVGLEMLVDIDPALPRRYSGDLLRIKQILVNLLSNAVKYTEEGEVILRVIGHAREAGEIDLIFSVTDTGAGIEPERLSQLFTAFYQQGAQGLPGSGLGLALSKGLAVRMGGDLVAESTLGVGSVFTLSLPQTVIDPTPMAGVSTTEDRKVLVAGSSRNCEALVQMLERLSVPYTHLPDAVALDGHLGGNGYSHLFYGPDATDAVSALQERLAGCSLVAVQDPLFPLVPDGIEGAHSLLSPLLIADVARQLCVVCQRAEKGSADLGSVQASGVQVLVVDDNEINLIVATEILSHYDFEVSSAESGPQAIELAKERDFDLIFMDHMMPDMDGVETTQQIRALGGHNETVPIIALTANALVGTREFFLENRLDDYLSKPIDIAQLNTILQRWLPQGKLHSEIPELAEPPPAEGHHIQSPLLLAVSQQCPIDVSAALSQAGGSEDMLLTILRVFLGNIQNKIDLMHQWIDAADWNGFRIEVHAQKSALHNIGATELSEQARKLEMAATEEDIDYIQKAFPAFIDGVGKLRDGLLVIFPQETSAQRIQATEEQIQTLPGRIRAVIDLLNALEHDEALEALGALAALGFGDSIDGAVDEAANAVDNFDYDKATALLLPWAEAEKKG